MSNSVVHMSNYSSHNRVQIQCDESWTEPKWGPTSGLTDILGVYEAEDDRLYTFEKKFVTCAHCKGFAK